MKIYYSIFILIVFFFVSSQEVKGTGVFERFNPNLTCTNITIELSTQNKFWIIQKEIGIKRLQEGNEKLILPNECETILTDGRHVSIYFTPVKNVQKENGFKVTNVFFWEGERNTNSVEYVLLDEIFTQIDENEIGMIIENGEWKNIKEKSQKTFILTRGLLKKLFYSDSNFNESKSSHNWLLWLAFSMIIITLFLIRHKRKIKMIENKNKIL